MWKTAPRGRLLAEGDTLEAACRAVYRGWERHQVIVTWGTANARSDYDLPGSRPAKEAPHGNLNDDAPVL